MHKCEWEECPNQVEDWIPYSKKRRRFCSKSCASKNTTRNQWARNSHRDMVSEAYERKRIEYTDHANEQLYLLRDMDHYSREYLERLSELNYGHNNRQYGILTKQYPIHWERFDNMITRAKTFNIDCSFEYTKDSFILFIMTIGPIPEDMVKPTVGRNDHSVGYVLGNFKWQSFSDNASEQAQRRQLAIRDGMILEECPIIFQED